MSHVCRDIRKAMIESAWAVCDRADHTIESAATTEQQLAVPVTGNVELEIRDPRSVWSADCSRQDADFEAAGGLCSHESRDRDRGLHAWANVIRGVDCALTPDLECGRLRWWGQWGRGETAAGTATAAAELGR